MSDRGETKGIRPTGEAVTDPRTVDVPVLEPVTFLNFRLLYALCGGWNGVTPSDSVRLVILAILWGASFLFLRIASPEFGPLALILIRSVIGATFFAVVFLNAANRAIFRRNLGRFFILGALNTALPFCLLAYATLSLEAGFTSLLNATTPLFAALIGAVVFSTPLRRQQTAGLAIAFCGVAVLSWDSLSFKPDGSGWAIMAALGAAMSYGMSVNFVRHRLTEASPQLVSAGALVMASLTLLPFGIWLWPDTSPSPRAWTSAILLGVACTTVAFHLFFNLLARSGTMPATSVTFLIPVFAILWGASILGEKIDTRLVAGMLITLSGTALTVGLIRPRIRLRKRTSCSQADEKG